MNLVPAMTLAGHCLLAWLDPDRGFMPVGGYETAHDTGRWWDAMLRLEHATGFPIPPETEAAMLGNLRLLTDNPFGILMNRPDIEWMRESAVFNAHNLRETFLSLSALARYRRSEWAVEAGRLHLRNLGRFLLPDGGLDQAGIVARLGAVGSDDPLLVQPPVAGWRDETASTGRALEAILDFHEATGDPLALQVAHRIARFHLEHSIHPTGTIRPELVDPCHVGHNHSYLGTLRGLLRYGIRTDRPDIVSMVAATYRNALWRSNISWSGWTPHDLGKTRFPDAAGDPVGEHASCGDVVQLALWLGIHLGRPEYLDDAERLLRARLLPSQVVDDPDPRQCGAWGVFGDNFGRGSILDVFAAVLHTLVDAAAHTVLPGPGGSVSIHLHATARTPWADVRCQRGERGRLEVVPRKASGLRIRVPGWAPRDSLALSVDGRSIRLRWESEYLLVAPDQAAAGSTVVLSYDLPRSETVEEMPVSRRRFRLAWRGDGVTACDPPVPIHPAW